MRQHVGLLVLASAVSAAVGHGRLSITVADSFAADRCIETNRLGLTGVASPHCVGSDAMLTRFVFDATLLANDNHGTPFIRLTTRMKPAVTSEGSDVASYDIIEERGSNLRAHCNNS